MNTENKKQQKCYKTIRFGFLIFILAFASWFYGFNNFVDNIPRQIRDTNTQTDAIVILTGGADRISTALNLLNQKKAKKLLISGVGSGVSLDLMLILSGELPDNIADMKKNIEVGYDALDTKGNAREAKQWAADNNFNSLRLVTADYHIPRSMLEFKKIMPDLTIIPHPVTRENVKLDSWWKNGGTKKLLIFEYNKYIAAKIL